MPLKTDKEPIKFEPKFWDIKNIVKHPVILLIGKRRTGKTKIVKDYLRNNNQYSSGILISPTEMVTNEFSANIPPPLIHHKFDSGLLSNVIKRQTYITEKVKHDPQYKFVDPSIFIIMDDCLADKKLWVNDENIGTIFYNGRHLQITFIITVQYLKGIPPSLRENVDYVILLREPRLNVQKKIYDEFAGMFGNFDFFRAVLDECTDNYKCLVLDIGSQSKKLEESVYWYKANVGHPDFDTFKICDNIFWDLNTKVKNKVKTDNIMQQQVVNNNVLKKMTKSNNKFDFNVKCKKINNNNIDSKDD